MPTGVYPHKPRKAWTAAQKQESLDRRRASQKKYWQSEHGRAARSARMRVYRQTEKNRRYRRLYQGLPEPTRPCPELCEIGDCPKKAVALDHCHTTGIFRGWLCTTHNTAIGKFGDTIAGVQRAIDYLEKAYA